MLRWHEIKSQGGIVHDKSPAFVLFIHFHDEKRQSGDVISQS